MKQATKRSLLRWIHIVFTIPILGYVYSPASEVEQYAGAARFVFVPVLILSGYWMYSGVVFAIIGVARMARCQLSVGIWDGCPESGRAIHRVEDLVGDSCPAFEEHGDSAIHKLDGRSNGAGNAPSTGRAGLRNREGVQEGCLVPLFRMSITVPPGRPGWFPTQAPHRSGSARHNTSIVTRPDRTWRWGELVVNTLVNAHPFYALSLLLNILLRVGH